MPALGAGMDVGRIIEWHVKAGDQVHRGDIVALVETDKANIDVEVFEDGVIEEILIEEGTKVPVGTPLARIGAGTAAAPGEPAGVGAAPGELTGVGAAPGESTEAGAGGPQQGSAPVAPPTLEVEAQSTDAPAAGVAPAGAPGVATPPVETPASGGPSVPESPAAPGAEIPAAGVVTGGRAGVGESPFVTSPLVRRQAGEVGVDLTHVHGTGPGGSITRHDVDLAAAHVSGDGAGAPGSVPSGHRASPYARRLAAERDLDPAELEGSGPGGVVIARDVAAAAAGATVAPAPAVTAPPTGEREAGGTPAEATETGKAAAKAEQQARALAMRQAIARAMERANREIPHYYLGETLDAEDTLRWLGDLNADRPPADRILPAALVLKATALALREYPDFNGYWIDDAFQPGDGIHLGVAINLRRGGLLAPAIRDADERSLDDLMAALKDLVARTRAGGLKGSELTDPTITVSNLGDTGVETIQGVITPPQVALVGVGRITEKPWAVDGMLAVRRTIYLSLAGDHRASDGHRGGRFLAAIAANLGRPETLT
jgi:pyruvate dehydrogenase E2 component (dihydrolipoamide acetyltransferase)